MFGLDNLIYILLIAFVAICLFFKSIRNKIQMLLQILVIFLPWSIRRVMLIYFYGYEIHPTARIGFSYIYPKHLVMEEGARIGHLNVAIHLNNIFLGKNVIIDRGNWITGFPVGTNSKHFVSDIGRKSELLIGKESAITKNHHIDCTNSICIGCYVTIAGYRSQFLTHSINIYENRQESHPIVIGNYCFVATGVKILGGSVLPNNSVLGAGAVLNKKYTDEYKLYAGIPARPIKELIPTAKYFCRKKGFVN